MISPTAHPAPPAPLWTRSAWSMLRGTIGVEDLLDLVDRQGHHRVAVADVNSLCGLTRFWKAADGRGIQPIVAAELHDERTGLACAALVSDQPGYGQLCRVISRLNQSENQGEQSACPDDQPAAGGHEGRRGKRPGASSAGPDPDTPGLSADLASLGSALDLIADTPAAAEALLAAGVEPRRLWLGIDPFTQSASTLRAMGDLARRRGLRPVATGRAQLARPADTDTARLLTAIRTGRTLDTVAPEELPHPRSFLRPPAELLDALGEWPQAIANNHRLAERCAAYRLLPRQPVFPRFACPAGLSAPGYLHQLCRDGLRRRYGSSPSVQAQNRLARELRLIEKLGFCEYFLVVWDIVQYARRHNAPVAGRGSGASSIVAYVLGITNVCPLTYRIPFERFIHEQREDFPDLDVDFCWRIRDDVIDYALDRWGRDHTAMVSMHTTFQPRSAFREAAKALGASNEQISRIAEEGPGAADESLAARAIPWSRRIAHLPRNLSVHPGGIIITPGAIDTHVPVQPATKGVPITQFDKDGVEDIGLVKIDLLGNRNLATVRYACDLIRRRDGVDVDIEAIADDDPPTIARIQAGRTVGCNQFESPAMRHLLKMMAPENTRDLMQTLALIRPGAAGIGMKEVFIRRRRGLDPVPDQPDQLLGLLDDSFGVLLHEDDVMLVLAGLTGLPLPQADRFRKAIQKCHDDRAREDLSRRFLRLCDRNRVDPRFARDIWVHMAKFNAYSFCRAHAASYAALAYAGAYLRTHWPEAFWTAALNNNQSMYHPRVYVEQAKRDGIEFLLPDVNASELEFDLQDHPDRPGRAIRMGLGLVAGLGPVTIERILDARGDRPFASLTDLQTRARLGSEETRALILCGAADSLGVNRPTLMVERNLHEKLAGDHTTGPMLLPAGPTVPVITRDYSPARKYFDERAMLGMTPREHIMRLIRPHIADRVDADSRDLPRRVGRRIRLAGVLEARRTTAAQSGGQMLFLTLDDEFGLFEVTLFPDACRRSPLRFDRYGPYVAVGRVGDQYGSLSVTADHVAPAEVPEHVLRERT